MEYGTQERCAGKDETSNSKKMLFSSKPDLYTTDNIIDMTRRFYSTLELEKVTNVISFDNNYEATDLKFVDVEIIKYEREKRYQVHAALGGNILLIEHLCLFSSLSDKAFWLNLMSKRRAFCLSTFIASLPAKPTISVKLDDGFASVTRKIAVDEYQTTKDIADNTFSKLNISKSDRSNFDIFVVHGQYRRPHLLLGYESSLGLLIHQSRIHGLDKNCASKLCEQSNDSNLSQLNFVLKRRKKARSKSFSFDSRSSYQNDFTKIASRGDTLVRKFKRKMLSKRLSSENDQSSANQTPKMEPKTVNHGLFFGVSLPDLLQDRERLPEPLELILTVIYEKGSFTEGIFRKSPNIRQYKEARDALDMKLDVRHLTSTNPILCGSLLKEFLRLLPQPLFSHEILTKLKEYYESSMEIPSLIRSVKKVLLHHMTAANMTLLRHLIYLLRRVVENEDVNFMNLINLAICLSPCLLAKYQTYCSKDDSLCQILIPILRILIDNYDSIFDVGAPEIFRRFHLNLPLKSIDEFNNEAGGSDLESLKHSVESLNSVFDRGSQNLITPPIVPFAVSKDSGLGGSRDFHQHERENFANVVRRVSSSLRRNSEHAISRTTNFRRQNPIRKSWLARKSMTTTNVNLFGRRRKNSFNIEKNRQRSNHNFDAKRYSLTANKICAALNEKSCDKFYGVLFFDDQDEFQESYV
uniref:Rho-GAP domain-containing protein n=1 Tax=Romanomermis culicivorax TaxID=13658 RepID=A0A915JRW2_ROMCU